MLNKKEKNGTFLTLLSFEIEVVGKKTEQIAFPNSLDTDESTEIEDLVENENPSQSNKSCNL